jgi:hypothetical protein
MVYIAHNVLHVNIVSKIESNKFITTTKLKITFYKQNIKHSESQVNCRCVENNDSIWIIIVGMYI